jgi:ATP-binding cassette subfamily B protein
MIPIDNYENNFFYLPYNLEGDIIFKNLNYKIGSKELFSNLNLTIKRGEKLLLSGASGSGKSTLLKMLLRYVETDTSTIFINNIDINHYHLENIRSNITYVTSNEYLFTDTLRNNISMYKEVTEEELHKVCSICCVDEIIKSNLLEYDTLIEENGFNFSNGEKQRIILARSLLRNSAIYIFDEAFSGIDITREKKILEEIFKYLKDKTVIVISHRFNNKKVFDRVLKLERGKIIETT